MIDGSSFHWTTDFLGRMLETTSEIFYVMMLILLGKGYTVTRARLRAHSVVKVTAFMSLYCVTCIALFTYERQVSLPLLEPWLQIHRGIACLPALFIHYVRGLLLDSISILEKFSTFTNRLLDMDCWFSDFWGGWCSCTEQLSPLNTTQKRMAFICRFSSFPHYGITTYAKPHANFLLLTNLPRDSIVV